MSRRNSPSTSTLACYFTFISVYCVIIAFYLYTAVFQGQLAISRVIQMKKYLRSVPSHEYTFFMKHSSILDQWLSNTQSFQQQLTKLNSDQPIYNLDIFGPLTNSTKVIVIQVHTRMDYLNMLLDQLSRVRGINDSLLIFSHDLFFPSVNEDIRKINFTRVMQIFYPFSWQLYPDRWPGPDEKSDKKFARNCHASQLKLHWWWKLNFVFGRIRALGNYSGVISFTEEDTYFTENSLWMLDLMEESMIKNECGGCSVLSLAERRQLTDERWRYIAYYKKPKDLKDLKYSRQILTYGIGSIHLAFNRTVWRKLVRCSARFCGYNDYNWDWTLRYVSRRGRCLKGGPLKVLELRWPRVFHTGGDCGHHFRKRKCDPGVGAGKAQYLSEEYAGIYPQELGKMVNKLKREEGLERATEFGGFGHPKDVELCRRIGRWGGGGRKRKLGSGNKTEKARTVVPEKKKEEEEEPEESLGFKYYGVAY